MSNRWKDVEWARLPAARVARLRNLGFGEEGPEPGCFYAVYAPRGEIWPRLVVSVQVSFEDLIVMECARKDGPGSWWTSLRGVPPDLLGDLLGLWAELAAALRP